jgi:beta-lactamase regulating signal transducer with metallopeptidase domain
MTTLQSILLLVLIVLTIIVLVYLLRNFVLWYYRINEKIELQTENNRLLNEILNELRAKKE